MLDRGGESGNSPTPLLFTDYFLLPSLPSHRVSQSPPPISFPLLQFPCFRVHKGNHENSLCLLTAFWMPHSAKWSRHSLAWPSQQLPGHCSGFLVRAWDSMRCLNACITKYLWACFSVFMLWVAVGFVLAIPHLYPSPAVDLIDWLIYIIFTKLPYSHSFQI